MITIIAFQITIVRVIFKTIVVKLRVLNIKCVLCYVSKIERHTKKLNMSYKVIIKRQQKTFDDLLNSLMNKYTKDENNEFRYIKNENVYYYMLLNCI